MTAKRAPDSAAASKRIAQRIQELGDWRGGTLAWVIDIREGEKPDEVAFKELIGSAAAANQAARAGRASSRT